MQTIKTISLLKYRELIEKAKQNKKHYTILVLLYNSGLRVSELINLRITDIDNESILTVIGKGDKTRRVPLNNISVSVLKEYLQTYKPTDYIFYSNKKNQHAMTRQAVNSFINKYKVQVGIKKLHPHMFRHSFATVVVKAKGIERAQPLLGHSNINTTAIYTHISMEDKKESVNVVGGRFINWLKGLFKKKIYNKTEEESFNYKRAFRTDLNTAHKIIKKDQNLLVMGARGIGKSEFIQALASELSNIIPISRLETKQDILNLIEILKELHFYQEDIKFGKYASIDIARTINPMIAKEFILVVENVSRITKKQSEAVQEIFRRFQVITTSDNIRENMLETFTTLELHPLTPQATRELISESMPELKNYPPRTQAIFIDEVYKRSQGFYRSINELINRYKSEDLRAIQKDGYVNYSNTRSLGFIYLFGVLFLGMYLLKLSATGISITAIVYVLLLSARMVFYSVRKI